MAVFSASPITSGAPTVQYDLPADLQAAQGLAQGQNALTMQGQQVSDMQQEVALRQGVAAGDPNALSQLGSIDPAMAQAARANQIQQATMPYQMAQARMQLLSAGASGVLASDDKPAAYAQFLSTLPPSIAASMSPTYPGDGPTQQMAFAGMNPKDLVTYLQTHIAPAGGAGGGGGAAPTTYAGATAGAETGGAANPNTATNPNSSAAGPDQFISGTWLQEMKTHRPDLTNGLSDPQILALRTNPPANDPGLSAEMTNDYAGDNAPTLQQHSIPITPVSLYAAHHFGPQGAVDLYSAEAKDPNTPVSSIFPPDVLKANPGLAGQTADTLLGGIRVRMQGVAPGTFGAPLAQTQPVAMTPGAGSQPATYSPAATPPAASPAAAPAAPAPSSTIPAGVTPLQHGDGSMVPAPGAPGFALGRDANGNFVNFPIPGGPADPAVIAQQAQIAAQAKASTDAPFPGGPTAGPPAQIAPGPFPPRASPYAGLQNNPATGALVQGDRKEAAAAIAADAPIISKDIANIQFDQQFHDINQGTPTGPYQAGDFASVLRAGKDFFGGGGSDPYQEMGKLSANLKTAALPSNLGRLDLPIIKAVAEQQPNIGNKVAANNDIEQIQIAAAQRDIDYRTARGQWVQQFGDLHGFDPLWTSYNNAVPTLAWAQKPGTVQIKTGAPSFQQWVASQSGAQAQGSPQGQPPAPQQQAPQPQPAATQQASTGAPANANAPAGGGSLAALEGHMVSQGGHTFRITNGVPVLVQ